MSDECPNASNHTPSPSGYLEYAEWARQMTALKFKQTRCGGCGLWEIWRGVGKPPIDLSTVQGGCLTCNAVAAAEQPGRGE